MIALVICFYVSISIYHLAKLWHKDLKREIAVYVFMMSISVIISSLVALKIYIPSPMIYIGKFFELLKNILGG
ncbi:hypothetical protein [Clostridium sp. KNHs214]|uniref:hypothetical protein n=1 Tax=Clostridium sp. KNHs214 TaxID=1540257 RepID=UPI0005507518|nr:hypothetical protein [Clostridium sp. KNHs214]